MPVSVTVCGDPVELSATESVAEKLAADAGVKVTEMVHVDVIASEDPQVLAEIAKSVGIELPTLRRLYLGGQGRQGWLLGFAALSPDVAARALQKLSQVLSKEL